jgi:hypothetical protein
MLPKDVLSIVSQELNLSLNKEAFYEASENEINAISNWLLSADSEEFPAVRKYVYYLKLMYETFWSIYTAFPKRERSEGKSEIEQDLVATNPDELIHLANYLYILDSYDVTGAVMECGCFKGFSSCCLSHVCAYLGRELILADSFEGLPANYKNDKNLQGHVYQEGELTGTLEEVQRHIELFGHPEVVTYIKGFYSDSLENWTKPIALLWLDVDLYDSAMDVLSQVFPSVNPNSMVFSHEIREHRVKNNQFVVQDGPAGAYHDFFTKRGVQYKAKWLNQCLGQIGLEPSICYGSGKFIETFRTHLRDSDLHYQYMRYHIRHIENIALERQNELEQLRHSLTKNQQTVEELEAALAEKDNYIRALLNGRVLKTILTLQNKTNSLLGNRKRL